MERKIITEAVQAIYDESVGFYRDFDITLWEDGTAWADSFDMDRNLTKDEVIAMVMARATELATADGWYDLNFREVLVEDYDDRTETWGSTRTLRLFGTRLEYDFELAKRQRRNEARRQRANA